MCIVDPSNISLEGDYYSTFFSYLDISVTKCKGSTCKNSSEIASYLKGLQFSVSFVNAFFDFNSYE